MTPAVSRVVDRRTPKCDSLTGQMQRARQSDSLVVMKGASMNPRPPAPQRPSSTSAGRPIPPPPPPPIERKPWQAKIERAGLFSWFVWTTNGLIQYGPDGGPFYWFGSRKRIEQKARRLLERLEGPGPETFVITWGED